MVVDQRKELCCSCSMALVLCLFSVWIIQSESQDHGITYEKDPGVVSPAMTTFFHARPDVALPEAQNVTAPSWRAASRVPPPKSAQNGYQNHTVAALLIAGVVFGVVGAGLLGAAAVAYIVHARQSRTWTSRPGSEVRLGSV